VVECEPRFAIDLACLTGDKSVGPDKRLDMLLDAGVVPDGMCFMCVFAICYMCAVWRAHVLHTDPLFSSLSHLFHTRTHNNNTGIEHISIIRPRKKATNKEFNNTLRLLRQDSDMLNKATSDAQRKAGLAVSSVDGFKMTVVKKYDPNTMSISHWRWIWAIGRVILQNYVAAVVIRLERYEREIREREEGIDPNELVESALVDEKKPRRLKESRSGGTRLPSLTSAKTGRHSMSSLRRISRGSREPRPIDDFSAAFSGAVKKHADTHADGRVAFVMNQTSSLPALLS